MPIWLEAFFGAILLLIGEADDFISKHWAGIVIFFAFWELWKINSSLQNANSTLNNIADILAQIRDHTDAMSEDDRDRQAEKNEYEYFNNLGRTDD
jgi:hypothetical protein